MEQLRTIIVTGSNKGIGYGIVENLAKKSYKIVMACRSLQRGQQAKDEIIKKVPQAKDRIDVLELEVSETASIDTFVNNIKQKYGQVDILLNNAGMAFKGDEFNEHVVKTTLQTNFYGTVELSEKMIPYIKSSGKIIIVGSSAGKLRILKSQDLVKQFTNEKLTKNELFQLASKFIDDVKNNVYEQQGWPKWGYGVSKLLINTYVRVLSNFQEIVQKNIQVYTCCPGWVKTDMAGQEAELTIDEGALTPCYLADLPHQVNKDLQGKFFYKCAVESL